MWLPRFFAADMQPEPSRLTLSETESQHLARVLRLGVGDRVRVFNGRGEEYEAAIEVASVRATVVRLEHAVLPIAEAAAPVTLAQGLLKGDSMDSVIRDATMLGVRRIVPLVTRRTNVSTRLVASGKAQDRWTRVAIASAKQCGRAHVPVIEQVQSLEVVLSAAAGLRLFLAEPALGVGRRPLPAPDIHGAVLVAGPEGGWAPQEIELAEWHGWTSWSIVPWILRAECVAITALSVLQYEWNAQGAIRG